MKKEVVGLLVVAGLGVLGCFVLPDIFFALTHKVPSEAQFQKAFPGDSRKVLEHAQQLTLLSLDPGPLGQRLRGKNTFHGYRILGQTSLGSQQKKAVLLSLYDGMADPRAFRAACFTPRHGIRAVQNGKTVELVICFRCMTLATYIDKLEKQQGSSTISKSSQTVFDRTLADAGVPLSSR